MVQTLHLKTLLIQLVGWLRSWVREAVPRSEWAAETTKLSDQGETKFRIISQAQKNPIHFPTNFPQNFVIFLFSYFKCWFEVCFSLNKKKRPNATRILAWERKKTHYLTEWAENILGKFYKRKKNTWTGPKCTIFMQYHSYGLNQRHTEEIPSANHVLYYT